MSTFSSRQLDWDTKKITVRLEESHPGATVSIQKYEQGSIRSNFSRPLNIFRSGTV